MPETPLTTPHSFSADRPLTYTNEDKLDRAAFARRLAQDIMSWHGNDSLVVSLTGEWGSGKSSLKNFVLQHVREIGKPIVIEFNPWEWSGQEKLIEGFFGALRAKFQLTDKSGDTDAMADRLEELEEWTTLAGDMTEQTGNALGPLLGTGGSTLIALISSATQNPWIQGIGLVSGVVGVVVTTVLPIASGFFGKAAKAARRRAARTRRTLEQLRHDISVQLRKLRTEGHPVLVVIDDIDRLAAEEIRLLFQLVKVNADFPNLVFVMLFQRDLVVKALTKSCEGNGERYLEKIVQVEFDIPNASRPVMQSMLQGGLEKIFDKAPKNFTWDKERFDDIFYDNLWPYFRTIRSVKRFLVTFEFYFRGHTHNNILQVNTLDLLIIEILRTFDHEAYVVIANSLGLSSRDMFTRTMRGSDERKTEIVVRIEALLNRPKIDALEKSRLKAIIQCLFPDDVGPESMSKGEREYRIFHPDYFSRYFDQTLDGSATSVANVISLIEDSGDRRKFTIRLRNAIAGGSLQQTLKKLKLHLDEIPRNNACALMAGLFDMGDEMPAPQVDWFTEEPTSEAARILVLILRAIQDSGERRRLLMECLAASEGVVVPTKLIAHLVRQKQNAAPDQTLILENDLVPLKASIVARIGRLAMSDKIWDNRHFAFLLFQWRDLSDHETVRQWLSQALVSGQRSLDFATNMLMESLINGKHINLFLSGKSLESFMSLERLAQRISEVPVSNNPRRETARKLVERALELKRSGQSYDEVRDRDDFSFGS